jgi:hypothetical protein
VKVRTTAILPSGPQDVWPLLSSSSMDRSRPCLFHLGVPKPVECRLPAGGGVGARRECVSEQGRVIQRITRWDPPRALSFEMVKTDLFFADHVVAIEEAFDLESAATGTKVVRTTRVRLKSGRACSGVLFWIGLKQVHRYVFRNWALAVQP